MKFNCIHYTCYFFHDQWLNGRTEGRTAVIIMAASQSSLSIIPPSGHRLTCRVASLKTLLTALQRKGWHITAHPDHLWHRSSPIIKFFFFFFEGRVWRGALFTLSRYILQKSCYCIGLECLCTWNYYNTCMHLCTKKLANMNLKCIKNP